MRWSVVAVVAGVLAPLSAHAEAGFCTMNANLLFDQTVYVSRIFSQDVIGAADAQKFGAYVMGTVTKGGIPPDHVDPPYCRAFASVAEAEQARSAEVARVSPQTDMRNVEVNWP